MAYTPQEVKIIPGGLNLAAPGDQMAPGDCLNLEGWWAGAYGKLEQAPSAVLRSAGTTGFSIQNSLCQVAERTYFGSSDTGELRQIGRAAEAAIDTGYDSSSLGMISYQGYCWIMNRSKQRKDNGTTVSDWTPAAPGVPALTNPSLTSSALTVTECDPGNPDSVSGDFSQIKCWISSSIAGMEVGALVTISGNASAAMNGTWQVTDIFDGSPNLIYLSANLPAATAYGLGGSATFANPSAPMGAYKYWVTWAYTDLGESNPSSSAGVITPATVSVSTLGTKIVVSIAALSPPTGAAYWNVYRQGPEMPSPYRVNIDRIPIATTSYDDYGDAAHSQDDGYLIDSLGILMEGDHDGPPAARVIANQVYNGRILVANSAAYPNRIWYTPPLQPGFFRGSGNPQAGDWVDVGTDRGDEVFAMTIRAGMVVIYRARSIWRHVGDFGDANARLECVVPDLGAVGVRSVVQTSLGDYFISSDGVYKCNGDWAQKISQKVEPLFRGLAVESLIPFANPTAETRARYAIGYYNGRLYVSPADASYGSLIYHVETERWFNDRAYYSAFLDAGPRFIGGGGSHFIAAGFGVLALEDSYDHDSSVLTFASAYQDCGLPDREKTWGDLVVNHNTAGTSLDVWVSVNKGATAADIFKLDSTLASSVMTRQVIPLVYPLTYSVVALRRQPIRSFSLSVRIEGRGASAAPGAVIDSPLILHCYLEARKGKSFDTGPTDHGTPEVKTIDQIEVDIDAPGGASLLIQSDIPGGVLQNQLTQEIAATSGRQVVRIVLTSAGTPFPIDGKLFRHWITSETDFLVYGFRVRALPIGAYLDGTVGDLWDSEAIPIGV